MDELRQARKAIDRIDAELARLFEARMAAAAEIGYPLLVRPSFVLMSERFMSPIRTLKSLRQSAYISRP